MKLIDNVKIYGLSESIKASKYPMSVDNSNLTDEITPTVAKLFNAKQGSGHDNALKGIVVQFDITMTSKMSVELERYHFIDFVSSQSTMHRITKFDLDKAYIKYVDKRVISIMKEKIADYNEWEKHKQIWIDDGTYERYKEIMSEKYLEILYTNPCGFQLTARMTTNYQQLKTMYFQRRSHLLPEWTEFCDWCEKLPHFKELCLSGKTI